MKIKRRFTTVEGGPYAEIEFHTVTSEIRNPDGSTVFKNDSVEVPTTWSQVASDIIAQKYFRKAGLPVKSKPVEEADVPSWLWRQEPDTGNMHGLPKDQRTMGETSSKQVFHRLAGTWTYWGWKGGYFDSEDDARSYYDEMTLLKERVLTTTDNWYTINYNNKAEGRLALITKLCDILETNIEKSS